MVEAMLPLYTVRWWNHRQLNRHNLSNDFQSINVKYAPKSNFIKSKLVHWMESIDSICILRERKTLSFQILQIWVKNPVEPVIISIEMLIRLDFISKSSCWKLISMFNLYANYYWKLYDRNSCSVKHCMRIVPNELGLWL